MAPTDFSRIRWNLLVTAFAACAAVWAQSGDEKVESVPVDYVVDTGAKIPLSLINSVSTKHSAEGDRVYLETVFPILVKGRIAIPPGSYVAGTVTQVKR